MGPVGRLLFLPLLFLLYLNPVETAKLSFTYQPSGVHYHYSYGLHSRCSSVTESCDYFPQAEDCHGENRYFCSMWRTVGFLMSFAVVLEGMTLIAYLVILTGDKQRREFGWRILAVFLFL